MSRQIRETHPVISSERKGLTGSRSVRVYRDENQRLEYGSGQICSACHRTDSNLKYVEQIITVWRRQCFGNLLNVEKVGDE